MPRLTETQKQLLLGLGVSVTGSLIVAAILSVFEARGEAVPGQHSLSIEATPGGRTEPAAGYYTYDVPTVVTVKAIVFDGYVFNGWYLDGSRVSTSETYSFVVDGQNLIIASFEKIGAPPLIPSYIQPIQNCVTEDWWDVDTTTEALSHTLHLFHAFNTDGFVKFKICDAAGNGIPGQSIAVYTDSMPDATDYGILFIGSPGTIHFASNPLILKTDSRGEVAVKCSYRWFEPSSDYRETIGQAGKVQVLCPLFIYYDVHPIHDGHYIGRHCEYTKFTRLQHPIFRNINLVHAYWVDNPSLLVTGTTTVDCMIKFMPSHEL